MTSRSLRARCLPGTRWWTLKDVHSTRQIALKLLTIASTSPFGSFGFLSPRCKQSRVPIHVIICLHMERNEYTICRLFWIVWSPGRRTGVKGTYSAIRPAVKGYFCLFDDNWEIIRAFTCNCAFLDQVLMCRGTNPGTIVPVSRRCQGPISSWIFFQGT